MSTDEMYQGQKYRMAKAMIRLAEGCNDAELIRICLKSYFKAYFDEDYEPVKWVES